MNSRKPELRIDISAKDDINLLALQYLRNAHAQNSYRVKPGFRPPLGIYNVSTSRILDKTKRCADRLEKYFQTIHSIDPQEGNQGLVQEIIDYMELALYSAAEHVDDLDNILQSFGLVGGAELNSNAAQLFKAKLTKKRRYISLCVNAVKHSQSRLRFFEINMTHDNNQFCLPGIFLELVENGVVKANPAPLKNNVTIFSATSILWEILTFIGNVSNDLAEFLLAIGFSKTINPNSSSEKYADAVIAASRLPLYSFDGEHPFNKTRVILIDDVASNTKLESGLYGSIGNKWSKSDVGQPGSFSASFEGDDVTMSFQLPTPKALNLQHWT